MDNALQITDKEIEELRSQIKAINKIQEYNQLKKDLLDISLKANNTLNEFDGGMKQVDTEQSLKNSRGNSLFSELFINRIIKMCNIRPIIGNLIALGLSCIGLIFIMNFLNSSDLKSLKIGLGYFLEIAAGIQIIKSASRSIVLPLITTTIGAIISNQLENHQLLFNHPASFFQLMMIVGLIGIGVSVFSID